MSLLASIVTWVKSNVVISAIVGSVIVGGIVATPIIINNINNNKQETKKDNSKDNKITDIYADNTNYNKVKICTSGSSTEPVTTRSYYNDNELIKIVKLKSITGNSIDKIHSTEANNVYTFETNSDGSTFIRDKSMRIDTYYTAEAALNIFNLNKEWCENSSPEKCKYEVDDNKLTRINVYDYYSIFEYSDFNSLMYSREIGFKEILDDEWIEMGSVICHVENKDGTVRGVSEDLITRFVGKYADSKENESYIELLPNNEFVATVNMCEGIGTARGTYIISGNSLILNEVVKNKEIVLSRTVLTIDRSSLTFRSGGIYIDGTLYDCSGTKRFWRQ